MTRHYPYVLVGGGMAADAAARGIREVDSEGSIALFSREPHPPYNRPPISKGLWKTSGRPMPISRIWRNTANLGVDVLLERTIINLDLSRLTLVDDRGEETRFDRLLLATGGDPIHLAAPDERVIYFRTLDDYYHLRAFTETEKDFLIIGGGFIGSEIAAALANLGKTVTMVFPEAGIGARVLPAPLAFHLNDVFHQRGVRVIAGESVTRLAPDQNGVTIQTDQQILRAGVVVAGLGIRPNIGLAQAAGLGVGNGITVNSVLQTSHPQVFAAGDVASFYSPALGRALRFEHEENANITGRLAGLGMAGQPQEYRILPSFYSTLFDNQFDAVGDLDPRLETWIDWQEPYRTGVAYYTNEGRVRGVLLWNINHGLEEARRLIETPGPFTAQDLRSRIHP